MQQQTLPPAVASTTRIPPTPSRTRIIVYIVAVLGLGWLGPLIDHVAGHALAKGQAN